MLPGADALYRRDSGSITPLVDERPTPRIVVSTVRELPDDADAGGLGERDQVIRWHDWHGWHDWQQDRGTGSFGRTSRQ